MLDITELRIEGIIGILNAFDHVVYGFYYFSIF